MNKHKRIAAVIALNLGILGLAGTVLYYLFAAGLAFISDIKLSESELFWLIMSFVLLCSLATLVMLAGSHYQNGAVWARHCLIVFNLVLLIGFPIGTVIGAYSLWAILKSDPQNSPT